MKRWLALLGLMGFVAAVACSGPSPSDDSCNSVGGICTKNPSTDCIEALPNECGSGPPVVCCKPRPNPPPASSGDAG